MLNQENVDQAHYLVEQFLKVSPQNLRFIHLRMWILLKQGKLQNLTAILKDHVLDKSTETTEYFWQVVSQLISDANHINSEDMLKLFSALGEQTTIITALRRHL